MLWTAASPLPVITSMPARPTSRTKPAADIFALAAELNANRVAAVLGFEHRDRRCPFATSFFAVNGDGDSEWFSRPC